MKKNIVFLGMIVALLLAACGTPATPATAPVEATEAPAAATEAPVATEAPEATEESAAPVEITFWSWVPHIEDQVKAFNASQSAIKVNYVNAGGGSTEYNKLKVALQANADVPDVVQIEYQLVPSFVAQDALLDLTAYGANDVKDKFVPWTWAQVSQGAGVYAYPQDAGPMVMFCNDAVLDKYKIAVPTTWDEFASAAAALHKADKNVYLSNFTADQGWFFGILWQAGGRPFKVDGTTVNVNFTSPEAVKVAKLWGDLIKSGNLSPVDTYTNDWNTALGNGSVACWPSGAWGTFISSSSPDFKGKWKVYPMPQWSAGGKTNGNYGGSSIAVTKASAHPKEAAAFAQWLNVDAKTTLALTDPAGAGLFPVTTSTLTDPKWKDVTYEYWSGQAIHQTMLDAANQVDVNFAWSPLTDFVFATYGDEITQVKAGKVSFEAALKDLQDKVSAYGKDQGFTITNN
jgi:multiple sugar transport system substrate-binding protein